MCFLFHGHKSGGDHGSIQSRLETINLWSRNRREIFQTVLGQSWSTSSSNNKSFVEEGETRWLNLSSVGCAQYPNSDLVDPWYYSGDAVSM